jgi:hypothetical protein
MREPTPRRTLDADLRRYLTAIERMRRDGRVGLYRRRSPVLYHPEHTGKHGVLWLSANHVALLQGLAGLPGETAVGRDEWVQAALPRIVRSRGGLPSYWCAAKSIRTLPTTLYQRHRWGNQWVFWLTPRGQQVVAGEVEVRVAW